MPWSETTTQSTAPSRLRAVTPARRRASIASTCATAAPASGEAGPKAWPLRSGSEK